MQAMLLWRELFTSVGISTRNYLSSLQNPQKQVRIRTIKPYKPAKMPDFPLLTTEESKETQGKPSGKQWFAVPENIEERLKRTTINKVGSLKKDNAFIEALYRLMAHWTETIQKTILQVTQSPLPRGAAEEIAYWKDSERVLTSLLSELNDSTIAKIDLILAGSAVHTRYLKELANLKQSCNQSKALALHLTPLEKHFRKLNSLAGVSLVLESLISGLEGIQGCCPYLTREMALGLLVKISSD